MGVDCWLAPVPRPLAVQRGGYLSIPAHEPMPVLENSPLILPEASFMIKEKPCKSTSYDLFTVLIYLPIYSSEARWGYRTDARHEHDHSTPSAAGRAPAHTMLENKRALMYMGLSSSTFLPANPAMRQSPPGTDLPPSHGEDSPITQTQSAVAGASGSPV